MEAPSLGLQMEPKNLAASPVRPELFIYFRGENLTNKNWTSCYKFKFIDEGWMIELEKDSMGRKRRKISFKTSRILESGLSGSPPSRDPATIGRELSFTPAAASGNLSTGWCSRPSTSRATATASSSTGSNRSPSGGPERSKKKTCYANQLTVIWESF